MAWVDRIETAIYMALLGWPRLRRGAALGWQAAWSIGRSLEPEAAGPLKAFPACFFGFHDKSPWSPSGDYLTVHFVNRAKQVLQVGVIEPGNDRAIPLATTSAWNWQQGAQLQWMSENQFVFNDFDRGGAPVVAGACLNGGKWTVSSGHLSALHRKTGVAAFSDYGRIDPLLKGYGYGRRSMQGAERAPGKCSDSAFSVKNVDVGTEIKGFSFDEIRAAARPLEHSAVDREAVSHFQFSPEGDLLAFFYLCKESRARTREISLMLLDISDGGLTRVPVQYPSHYCWGPDNRLFVTHLSATRRWCCSLLGLSLGAPAWDIDLPHGDGHVSYCSASNNLLVDTYPDRRRVQRLMAIDAESREATNLFAARIPLRFSGVRRCDFHPRWDETGARVCFDSAHTGERSLCVLDLPVGALEAACKSAGPAR